MIKKNWLIILITLIVTSCIKDDQTCTLIGCENSITIDFKNIDPNIQNSKIQISDDQANNLLLAPNFKNEHYDSIFSNYSVSQNFDVSSKSLTIQIIPLHNFIEKFKNIKILNITLSNSTSEINKIFDIDLKPFYPNGYNCDKDHPCFSETINF